MARGLSRNSVSEQLLCFKQRKLMFLKDVVLMRAQGRENMDIGGANIYCFRNWSSSAGLQPPIGLHFECCRKLLRR